MKRLLAAACPVAVIAALAGPCGPARAGDPSCTTVQIPVALGPDQPADQQVSAVYCLPGGPGGQPAAVDITVPGATYNHLYWDWPQSPQIYNYTDTALAAGDAVLDYDRLGTGASSKPPGTSLSIPADAYVLHQLITWARARFSQVNVIGHSMGSVIAVQDAATWPSDPSRLVLTGYTRSIGLTAIAAIAVSIHPADQDPQFAGSGLDPSYITTKPGTRGALFYAPGADPAVIAYDEAHKDAIGGPEFPSSAGAITAPAARQLTAPALLVEGQEDAIFCSGAVTCSSAQEVISAEAGYLSSAAGLAALVVPGTGHALALSPTAPGTFQAINRWLARIPAQPAAPAAGPAQAGGSAAGSGNVTSVRAVTAPPASRRMRTRWPGRSSRSPVTATAAEPKPSTVPSSRKTVPDRVAGS